MTSNKVLLSAVIIAAVTAGCRTDVLKKNRIAGEWTVESFVRSSDNENFIQNTSTITTTMTMEFDKDGDFDIDLSQTSNYYGYSYTYSFNFTGSWEDDDKDLRMDFDASSTGAQATYGTSLANVFAGNYYQLRETYDIIELTKDELEMEATINGEIITVKAEKED